MNSQAHRRGEVGALQDHEAGSSILSIGPAHPTPSQHCHQVASQPQLEYLQGRRPHYLLWPSIPFGEGPKGETLDPLIWPLCPLDLMLRFILASTDFFEVSGAHSHEDGKAARLQPPWYTLACFLTTLRLH